jgi:hypothetical protein
MALPGFKSTANVMEIGFLGYCLNLVFLFCHYEKLGERGQALTFPLRPSLAR